MDIPCLFCATRGGDHIISEQARLCATNSAELGVRNSVRETHCPKWWNCFIYLVNEGGLGCYGSLEVLEAAKKLSYIIKP